MTKDDGQWKMVKAQTRDALIKDLGVGLRAEEEKRWKERG